MIAFGNLSIEGKWKDKTFAAIAGPNLDSVDTDDNRLYYNMTNDNTTIDDNGIIRTSGEITGRVCLLCRLLRPIERFRRRQATINRGCGRISTE